MVHRGGLRLGVEKLEGNVPSLFRGPLDEAHHSVDRINEVVGGSGPGGSDQVFRLAMIEKDGVGIKRKYIDSRGHKEDKILSPHPRRGKGKVLQLETNFKL
jgi:hypothetical protein